MVAGTSTQGVGRRNEGGSLAVTKRNRYASRPLMAWVAIQPPSPQLSRSPPSHLQMGDDNMGNPLPRFTRTDAGSSSAATSDARAEALRLMERRKDIDEEMVRTKKWFLWSICTCSTLLTCFSSGLDRCTGRLRWCAQDGTSALAS